MGATYAAAFFGSFAPSQPSGTLKPTATNSDSLESGVSLETSERLMFHDMFGPLSGTPDGTINHAHVANVYLPAGQRPNNTPIFISMVSDIRSILALLLALVV